MTTVAGSPPLVYSNVNTVLKSRASTTFCGWCVWVETVSQGIDPYTGLPTTTTAYSLMGIQSGNGTSGWGVATINYFATEEELLAAPCAAPGDVGDWAQLEYGEGLESDAEKPTQQDCCGFVQGFTVVEGPYTEVYDVNMQVTNNNCCYDTGTHSCMKGTATCDGDCIDAIRNIVATTLSLPFAQWPDAVKAAAATVKSLPSLGLGDVLEMESISENTEEARKQKLNLIWSLTANLPAQSCIGSRVSWLNRRYPLAEAKHA